MRLRSLCVHCGPAVVAAIVALTATSAHAAIMVTDLDGTAVTTDSTPNASFWEWDVDNDSTVDVRISIGAVVIVNSVVDNPPPLEGVLQDDGILESFELRVFGVDAGLQFTVPVTVETFGVWTLTQLQTASHGSGSVEPERIIVTGGAGFPVGFASGDPVDDPSPTGSSTATIDGNGPLLTFDYDHLNNSVDGEQRMRFISFTVVPEPATLAMLAIGGVAMLRRRA